MSEAKKKQKKYDNIATPVGVGGYMWLHKPSTKFNADGVYEATVVFNADALSDISTKLEAIATEYRNEQLAEATGEKKGKLKNSKVVLPMKTVYDEEGNETGEVKIKAKQNAIIRFKDGTSKTVKPWVKDAKKNDTTAIPYAGSKVRVVFEPSPYYTPKENEFGVSLRLKGVQIIELVAGSGGGNGADLLDEEDGYTDDANEGSGALDDGDEGADGEASDF